MKKIFAISYLLIVLPVAYIKAQEQKGYEISGRIEGLKEGEKVLLKLFHGNGFREFTDWTRADSTYVKDGQFHLKGFVPEGPRSYWMEFSKHPYNVIRMLLDNEQISIYSTDIEKIPHSFLDRSVNITGSTSNEAVLRFSPAILMYMQCYFRVNGALRKIKDSLGFDSALVSGVMMAKQGVLAALYNTFLAKIDEDQKPGALCTIDGNSIFQRTDHAAFWIDVFNNNFDEREKNSFYGKKLKQKLPLCVGQPLPPFDLPDAEGKSLSLANALEKGKLTIVHFWAANSYLREDTQQELRELYKKYHSKGLNVIGLSSDAYIKEWKDMLQSEQFPWPNVIDVKGKIIDSVYHELGSNPATHNTTNVLLDGEGKIVAWDVVGAELQWYLWKYLDAK